MFSANMDVISLLQNPSCVSKEMLEIFSGYLRCCDLYNTSFFVESYANRSGIAQDMVEMLQ